MNTFAAAMDSIRGYLRVMETYPSKHEKDISESYAAIRVLEAAGATDKQLALAAIDAARRVLVNDGLGETARALRDWARPLLAALPEGEKK